MMRLDVCVRDSATSWDENGVGAKCIEDADNDEAQDKTRNQMRRRV